MNTLTTLIEGTLLGIFIGILLSNNLRRLFRNIGGGLWVLWVVTFSRLFHLIRYKERLSTYFTREYQKNIDDKYEKFGFPRGTFTEWQHAKSKGPGIEYFTSELHGFNLVYNDIFDVFPSGQEVTVVCFNRCGVGYWCKAFGWTFEGYTDAPVTHWKYKETKDERSQA